METNMFFGRTTWFTGRNGMFKAKGLDIWKSFDNLIVFSPITSKGRRGRCDIAIPKECIPDLIRRLSDMSDEVAIASWCIEDFMERAEEVEREDDDEYDSPTREPKRIYDRSKFPEALKEMERKHDAIMGITWDTIDFYLDEYCKIETE